MIALILWALGAGVVFVRAFDPDVAWVLESEDRKFLPFVAIFWPICAAALLIARLIKALRNV
jgi:hypothetical protein